jgi:hypothetical protein
MPDAKYVELPGRNMYHFVKSWRESFENIAEFLTRQHFSLTSWSQRAALRRWATASGTHCSMRTTWQFGLSSIAFALGKLIAQAMGS